MKAARGSKSRKSRPRTLYLVRHAIAAERGPKYPDDTLRPLTKRGIARMREAARGFADLDPAIDVVISSPLVRAKQTAKILLAELSPAPAHELIEELSPGCAPADLADALGRYEKQRTIALVGHEPDLGTFAAWLTGAHKPIPFKKGGIACFEVTAFPPDRNSTLLWSALPKMLRGLR